MSVQMSQALPGQPSPALPGSTTLLLGQMLLCSCLWGSSFLLMKLIGAEISPLALTALRGLMGAALLGLWLGLRGETVLPQGREWRDWAVLGLLQGAIPNTLTAYALTQITASLTSLIQACTPLIVAMLAHLLFADERLSAKRALGVLIGFSGMAILLGPAAFATGSPSAMGTLAMAATALSYALGNLYVRGIPKVEPARLALGQQVFSGLPTLVLVLGLSGPAAFAAAPGLALPLLALGIFATALPILLYMMILRSAGPVLGSMNGYLVPFWTILMGVTLLGESVGLREITGGLVVLTGLVIVSLTRRPTPAVKA
ncbi:DMT family transporter [Bosea vestrisii]|uniref:DMT family transporter n=1 Tax=Bosea vestrisii TaxID=151416 RepID=UPI0024DF9B14|nr:DMT family transporter [Bosea vestrisii]WID96279.1 DMT family transporter [Bosea vestrisii]